MDTAFINSKNNKTSNPERLVIKRSNKNVALLNLSIYYTWKGIKNSCKNNKFKISASTYISYTMDHILYHIF